MFSTPPFRTATAAIVAAAFLSAGGVLAQESGTSSSSGTADTELSIGTPAEPQVGDTYTRESKGDWEMRCLRSEDPEKDPCQMYQLLDDGQGAPVAEVSMFRLPEGGKAVAGGTIVVPLETALQRNLTISIDGGPEKRYPFAFCNSLGCYVRMGLTADDVAGFKKGREAVISIVPVRAPDQTVDLRLSLKGFTAAFDASSVIEP